MISYLKILYQNYGINPWITLILSIALFIAILFLIFMNIILFLDALYRPNIPQYPFNMILDRIIPFIALFIPSIIILFSRPFETWFARLTLLIMIHLFLLTPIFHYWSLFRCWDSDKDNFLYSTWRHPRLYKSIAIGLIYPLLWGIFFSFSRYLRLGITYDVWASLKTLLPDFFAIFFMLPYFIVWFIIIILYLLKIRQYFWQECENILYSIHIFLLKYYFYFRLMELIYKSGFFIYCLLTLAITYKNQGPWWRQLMSYLYYNPKWFTYIIISLLIFEIIITQKLYYGLYFIFIYTIIYRSLSCYFSYAHRNFIFDCCFSDYCNLKDKEITIRYPQRFWMYFQDATYYFGFEYEYTQNQKELLITEMNKPHAKWLLCKKISQELHHSRVHTRILNRPNSPFNLRVAANYLYLNHVRWMHTEHVLRTTYKYHSCTALFARTLLEQIVLLNSSWNNLKHIQATRNIIPEYPNMYKPYDQTFTPKSKSFIGIQEENIPSNFVPLMKKGVIVEPYDQTKGTHKPVFLPQSNPDTIFIFKNSKFIDKRTHAMDQKTNNPGIGNNKMLSEIAPQRYETTLDRFICELRRTGMLLNPDMITAVKLLQKTYNDFDKHQEVWAAYLHYFPDNLIPPLKLPQNFSYAQLTEPTKKLLKIAEYCMIKISEHLFAKKVPQINHGTFPEEALALFNDSYMQKILSEEILDVGGT